MSDHTEATIRASSDNCGAGPDCRICRDVRPLLRLLDEARAERDALPKKRAGDVDSLLDFYEARLAIAERLLKFASAASLHDECCSHFSEENAGLIACNCWLRDARAYLAHRAKEQP